MKTCLEKNNIICLTFISILITVVFFPGFAEESNDETKKIIPLIKDRSLTIKEFVTGLDWPTTMTFVGDDILVLEKNKGTVRLIQNGILQEKPVLQIPVVDHTLEHGMLGIVSKESSVYLYFSEADNNNQPALNRIFKYTWDGEALINPIHLKDLPAGSFVHNGGALAIDKDGTVFAVIGDIGERKGILQNFPTGDADDTSVILQVDPPGSYYAIGIRNSFGLAFDPITGNLWDTENGEDKFDEINLVPKKFNSGWEQVMGPNTNNISWTIPGFQDYTYSDPEFSFEIAIGLSAITFIQSDLFEKLKNSVLVGDFIHGNLYAFPLNENRDGFQLEAHMLHDLVANTDDTISEILFAKDFGGVTDIEEGPNGKIYVVSILNGVIYQISPNESKDFESLELCDYTSNLIGDLSGCDLTNLDLSNRDLSFVNFINANLSKTNLAFSKLSGADFTNADLTSTNFSGSKMDHSFFLNANMKGAILENVDLEGANLNGADLSNSNLKKSFLANAHLTGTNLMNSDLSETDFSIATLIDVNFENSILEKSRLTFANLTNANLKNANLEEAIIGKTNLTGVNLDGANLFNIYPWDTNFEDVVITEETKVNTCLTDSFQGKLINKILYEIRKIFPNQFGC